MEIPNEVEKAFKKLKTKYPYSIVLKTINGKYYVYKQISVWIKEKKKTKTASEYLGRISDSGLFLKKLSSEEDKLQHAKAIIESHGGKVTLPEPKIENKATTDVMNPTSIEKKILTILSMNSRASYKFIGELAGITTSAAYNHVKRIEEKFGIAYLAEIDYHALGYLSFVVFVKFIDKMPLVEEIKNALSEEPRVQLVLLTTGDYDMVFYILAKQEEIRDVLLLWGKLPIKIKEAKLYITPNTDAYGFIPLRDKFFDLMKNDSLKTTMSPSKKTIVSNREYVVLRELNLDGTLEFTKIDKKHNLERGASQYAYHSLIKKKIINRITITERALPLKYNVIFLSQVVHWAEQEKTRSRLLLDIFDETPRAINKYVYASNMGMPIGGLLILPIFNNEEANLYSEKLSTEISGIELKTLIITTVLIGSFCYRRFDNYYSRQYELLVGEYHELPNIKKIIYTEGTTTGRFPTA